MHGVYYILNTINQRIYVGESLDIDQRWKQHRDALKNNRHGNSLLQSDWNQYNTDAFEFGVLVTMPDWRIYSGKLMDSNTLERLFIRIYQSDNPALGYNTDHKVKGRRNMALAMRLADEANEAARKYRPS